MDGREGMALPGSSPYYLHRNLAAPGSQPHPNFNPPPGFRNFQNPSINQVQPDFRAPNSSVGPSSFNVEGSSPANFPPHGFTMTVASASASGSAESPSRIEVAKKKRGRPRKYAPDGAALGTASGTGSVSLGLSPLSSPSAENSSEKRKRGRPKGTGRNQRLASVGEWMSNSAGIAFTPHVIYVAAGEDIASKILTFSQQKQRALCIMSGSGGVSAVTLRQPASSVGNVTYEGRFEILCLSGSYLVAETGGARNRTGGVNVSLSSPDGQIFGGSVAGRLIASRAVQVVVCSFVYGEQKAASNPKPKTESDTNGEKNASQDQSGDNKTLGPGSDTSPTTQNTNPANIDINLTRGTLDKCKACDKKVYIVDLVTADGISYHKNCFRCKHCNGKLVLGRFSSIEGELYCTPHFEQLFREGKFQQSKKPNEQGEGKNANKLSSMFSGTQDKCFITVETLDYHKSCFRCAKGGCHLTPSNYAALDGFVYCKPHFAQLFKEKGSYSYFSKSISMKKAEGDALTEDPKPEEATEPESSS
ncbi:hypothetical protein V2J09_003179 [Rumex salicifolius]